MEVSVNTLSDVSREVEISTSQEELEPHFQKAYRAYRPKVEIRGFRKGKAPLDLIKKLYGDLIEQEALSEVAGTLYAEVVKDRELKPIGEPVVTDMNYKRGEGFRFKVQYDIRPTIVLKDYKGIPVEKTVHRVTDGGLEEEIQRLRKINSTTEPADRVTDDEHIVSVEIQELDESGVPLIGRKNQDARFYLADPELELPFKEALAKAERDGRYVVQFDHQHGDHMHAVHLALTVKRIEKVILPEVDDAFVKKISKEKYSTVASFRDSLRADLENYWKEKDQRQAVNLLVGELIRRHDFSVPESLVRGVLDGLLEDVKGQYPKRELPVDFDVEKFYEENRAYAIFQAKWALLREEIIAAEHLTVSDEDLAAVAEREAGRLGIEKERLLKYYQSSDQVKDRLIGDKLIDLLLEKAKIKEVVKDDVTASQ